MEIKIFNTNNFRDREAPMERVGVCISDKALDESTMKNVALRSGVEEIAFVNPLGLWYSVRWFAPNVEIEISERAAIAAAQFIFRTIGHGNGIVRFSSKSGEVIVKKLSDGYEVMFAGRPYKRAKIVPELVQTYSLEAGECPGKGRLIA